ncbi:MAG: hypothetical protein AB1765_07045 [Candidatus Hydrogenedentota bacterium]
MFDVLFNSEWFILTGGCTLLVFILIFTYLRYSTARFRITSAFKHNEAGVELLRRSKFTEAIREFEIALILDPDVEIFKNNIEIAKSKMLEAKNKEKDKIDALGITYEE